MATVTQVLDPRLMSDVAVAKEMRAIDNVTAPWYEALEAMSDAAFRDKSWKYVPEAQVLADQIKPYTERRNLLEFEQLRRAQVAANERMWADKDKRIAVADTWQRRNGWEIIKDRGQYALRHPVTKEEVYMGRLTRVRQVADESRSE